MLTQVDFLPEELGGLFSILYIFDRSPTYGCMLYYASAAMPLQPKGMENRNNPPVASG